MLFDLRSRGRRTTVRGVYLTLAILMGGGLILFGVGTGVSGGGLLNAFSGGGTSQNSVVSSAERSAEKAVKQNPNSAGAWASLLQARWTTATTAGSGFDATTGTFTKLGKSELNKLTQDWQRYTALTKNPNFAVATETARAYDILGNYDAAASAWQTVAAGVPTDKTAIACIALSAYAAKNTRLGDLAGAKALATLPKTQRLTVQVLFKQAKTSSTAAQQGVQRNCEQ